MLLFLDTQALPFIETVHVPRYVILYLELSNFIWKGQAHQPEITIYFMLLLWISFQHAGLKHLPDV